MLLVKVFVLVHKEYSQKWEKGEREERGGAGGVLGRSIPFFLDFFLLIFNIYLICKIHFWRFGG